MNQDDEIEAIGEKAGHFTRAVLDETQTVGEAAERLLAAIRDEPLKSALIALGVGAVFGFLMNREQN